MAFIQQGPRRPRQSSRPQDTTSASTSFTETGATSYHSLRQSTTSTPTATAQDWSIVFPGRTRSDHHAHLDDIAQSVIPSHDGTGIFGELDTVSGSTSLQSPASASDQRSDSSSSGQAHGYHDEDENLFVDDYPEEVSTSSSSGRPPSLLSANEGADPAYARGSNASTGSSRSADAALSPTLSHFSFDDDDAPRPAWSWEQDGETRVLASTTPRQRSPSRIPAPFRSSVIYASDSEAEEVDLSDSLQQRERTCPDSSHEDAQYEEALATAPFAMSAGLLPRRASPINQNAARPDHASSLFSGSQISAGFKRRHRRQHEGGSVRSSKSRRSEGTFGLLDAVSASNRRGAKSSHSPRLSATSAKQIDAHQRHSKPAAGPNPPATVSKKEKVAKLFGRLFDVDPDVYNSLMYDEGPLALTHQERHERVRQTPTFGFEYEQSELGGDASVGGKRWKELIDGRIVEDSDGEQGSVDEEENVREAERIEREVGPAHPQSLNPISALSRADWSSVRPHVATATPPHDLGQADPTLQEAIRHTISRSVESSQLLPGDVSATLSHIAPDLPAILSSSAGALHDVMPYFVPYSWRLLMRLVREWRSEERREKSPAQTDNSRSADEDQSIEAASLSGAEAESTASGEVYEKMRDETAGSSSVGRGRSRERKSLYDSVGSSWSLAASTTTASSGQTTRGQGGR
ncbi:hypothetical protein BCV69DRAFT_277987 [Microstroma glucosiphilum]|uniref:Uncharacterized protein n=1 Tax=Pseudomicrostroma glucosiphilum TaxID=1684307 RepID=A0A316U5T0_9BASI|nr:hypothetical protein BCV69DRAFT_277987 [Pseudomicrostroma glucosiphilum]PWN19693.1 hypothetical protein BCV69DRAFT_277987 [Pseudomicrostroma glucosiphilum]